MGLASFLLGDNNPFSQWASQNSGLLGSVGGGIAQGTNLGQGLSYAAQNVPQGKAVDLQARQQMEATQKAEALTAQAEALKTKYADFFNQNGQPDYAHAVADGIMEPGAAYGQWMQGKNAAAPKPLEINGQLVDPNTYQVLGDFRTPGAGANAPTLTSIYDANGREQKGYMNGNDFVPVGSPKANIERPEFNAAQALAAGYADRMTEADKILDDPNLAAVQTDIGERGKAAVPFIGNMLTSPEFQQAEQAQRDFINAILRRESGAAIAESEFASAKKQYFPQPGDSPQVLEQKKLNRINAIKGVARSAGPAYEQPGAATPAAGGGGNQTSTGVQWSVSP